MKNQYRYKKFFAFLLLLCVNRLALAEINSATETIVRIRPYSIDSGGVGAVYISLSTSNLCSTDVFKIDLSRSGSQEIYIAAMFAMARQKKVVVEVDTCQGYATSIRSLYVIN